MIIIDSKERSKHEEIVALVAASGEPYSVEPLDLGDMIVQGREHYVIERKAIDDFYSSLVDGRLWSQTKDLGKAIEGGYKPLVIIELQNLAKLSFDPRTKTRRYVETKVLKDNEMQFYNAQLGVTKWGVGIILTSSPQGTARFLVYLSQKLGQPASKKDYPERGGMKKNWSLAQKRLYLMEAFGYQLGIPLSETDMKELLESPLTAEQLREKLPKKYKSGRTIPEKEIGEVLEVLGFL